MPLSGIDWMKRQEEISPGFLERAYLQVTEAPGYENLEFTRTNDAAVALALQPFADLHYVTLTRSVVERARFALEMKAKRVTPKPIEPAQEGEVGSPPSLPLLSPETGTAIDQAAEAAARRVLAPVLAELQKLIGLQNGGAA